MQITISRADVRLILRRLDKARNAKTADDCQHLLKLALDHLGAHGLELADIFEAAGLDARGE